MFTGNADSVHLLSQFISYTSFPNFPITRLDPRISVFKKRTLSYVSSDFLFCTHTSLGTNKKNQRMFLPGELVNNLSQLHIISCRTQLVYGSFKTLPNISNFSLWYSYNPHCIFNSILTLQSPLTYFYHVILPISLWNR